MLAHLFQVTRPRYRGWALVPQPSPTRKLKTASRHDEKRMSQPCDPPRSLGRVYVITRLETQARRRAIARTPRH